LSLWLHRLCADLFVHWCAQGGAGVTETSILRGVGQSEHPGQTEEQYREYLAGASKVIPIGRLGRPNEVAAAVLFLASDSSS
jgi:NAD(P)-dependent dehydrogenase (short-subunit alcohol dehydrogenase family)